MVHYSVIEKLRKQAQVSYEDAREALEMTEWDVLDAYVWLEAKGRIGSLPVDNEENVQPENAVQENNEEKKEEKVEEIRVEGTVDEKPVEDDNLFCRLWRMGWDNRLVARNKNGRVGSLSIWGLLFTLLIFRKFALILFLLGLVMQVKYSFEGPDMKKTRAQ